jgi:hypothetical protein
MLLGVVVLTALVSFTWRSATPALSPSNSGAARPRAANGQTGVRPEALNVELDRLNAPPPPPSAERNPFRFEAKPPPEPIAVPHAGGGPGARGSRPETTAPTGPPAPPPIPLKFIGILDAPGAGKIAALSDGRNVFNGREGDIIDGRYRIVHIGVESIVLEHVDGRGRQTIPLTGQ